MPTLNKVAGYINMFTLEFTTKQPRNRHPAPSRKHQDLLDRMQALSSNAGIEKRGKYWQVWYNGTTACELRNLTEAAWEVLHFEKQAVKDNIPWSQRKRQEQKQL